MKKVYLLILPIILVAANVFSQEQAKVGLGLEGQIAATTNGKEIFINMGGPAVKFVFPKFAVALNMFPSLRIDPENSKSPLTPLLGMGPQIYLLKHRRFVLSFPFYYYATKNIWVGTAGIGYVLTKPKQ